MLKLNKSFQKLFLGKINSSKSASSKNNNGRLIVRKNNGNGKVNRLSVSNNNIEHTKKSGKLPKSKKSKYKKISKF